MAYEIKLTQEQKSFLINNLEPSSEFVHDDPRDSLWWMMVLSCWDEEKQEFNSAPIYLSPRDLAQFKRHMQEDAQIILQQLEFDVMHHTCNDTSWSNSKWCLEKVSDIISILNEAQFVEL
jgi:hypothetical protein